jgi:hypothetical protein
MTLMQSVFAINLFPVQIFPEQSDGRMAAVSGLPSPLHATAPWPVPVRMQNPAARADQGNRVRITAHWRRSCRLKEPRGQNRATKRLPDREPDVCSALLLNGHAIAALSRRKTMSIEGKAKEAAGYLKEEINEHGTSPEARKKAQEGRDLRNEGRLEDGKAPLASQPGTGE